MRVEQPRELKLFQIVQARRPAKPRCCRRAARPDITFRDDVMASLCSASLANQPPWRQSNDLRNSKATNAANQRSALLVSPDQSGLHGCARERPGFRIHIALFKMIRAECNGGSGAIIGKRLKTLARVGGTLRAIANRLMFYEGEHGHPDTIEVAQNVAERSYQASGSTAHQVRPLLCQGLVEPG
jgi:hypothetical protein